MATITINGLTLDPLAPIPAGMARAAAPAPTSYLLVQTTTPLTTTERTELAKQGATVLEHVPEGTYLCRADVDHLAAIRTLPFVRWVGPYMRGLKVARSLRPGSTGRISLAEAAAGPRKTMSDEPRLVDVVFHRDVVASSVVPKVAEVAGLDEATLRNDPHKVRIRVPARHLSALAALDEVRHIEEVVPAKLHNDVARQILGLDSANPGIPVPFTGKNQIVAVADTGFDKGSTTNVHPAFAGRVLRLYALGRANSNDPDGHGTHVAGSVLGDGPSSAALGVRVRGAAPEARLVLQSLLDGVGGLDGLPTDLHELFKPPYDDDGARVHTNSWGSTLGDGRYDANASELDDFVWIHRDCVICFAAGNEGVDSDSNGQVDRASVTPPGTAKNCITVGACENQRPMFAETYGSWWPDDFPAQPIASDRMADDPEGMVAFSSRGPTADRRFKPDVVAPGTFILSAKSRDTSDQGWAPSADPLYCFMGGTSMATPLVAGCAAVVRQYLIEKRGIAKPSAALVKAVMINGARDINGQYAPSEAGPTPNFAEGFGRVDMDASVGARASQMVRVQDEAGALDTGDEATVTVPLPSNATALKVTLVWTDPPGESLQNNLDLIVRVGAKERHGNVAPTSTAFDRVNNVEQVHWTPPGGTSAEIVVRADAITIAPQSYALIVRVV